MFLLVLLKEGSRFHLLFKKLLEIKPRSSMYFCLKTPQLDNIPSIRYKIWSHNVPNFRQHIRLYYLQLLIYNRVLFFSSNDSPLKTMRNVFYFI